MSQICEQIIPVFVAGWLKIIIMRNSHLCVDGCFPDEPGLTSCFYFHLFQKRRFGISGYGKGFLPSQSTEEIVVIKSLKYEFATV